MRKIVFLVALFISSVAFAGGQIGGGSGGRAQIELIDLNTGSSAEEIVNLSNSFNIERLPKVFMSGNELRRLKVRLSVDGIQSLPAVVEGEKVQLRSLGGSVVDVDLSKEVLPSD